MQNPPRKNPYNRRNVKDYILNYYRSRKEKFETLCFDDADESKHNFVNLYEDLSEDLGFEIKIVKFIRAAESVNKFEALIDLLKSDNPQFDIFLHGLTNPSFSSKPEKNDPSPIFTQNRKPPTTDSQLRRNIEPSGSQQTFLQSKIGQQTDDSPQVQRLRLDIEHLEVRIGSLRQIDDLLDSMRKRIGGLLNSILDEINLKQRKLQDEKLNATRKSTNFQREENAGLTIAKPTPSPKQPYVSPTGHHGSWGDPQFRRPN